MNKNTLLAFVLIMLTVLFFNSETWNRLYSEKILNQPYEPYQEQVEKQKEKQEIGATVQPTKEQPTDHQTVSQQQQPLGEENEPALTDTIKVETDKMIVTLTTEGGRILSIEMKDYLSDGEYINILPEESEGGAQLSINNQSFDKKSFSVVDQEKRHIVVEDEPFVLTMQAEVTTGSSVQKIFTFSNESYKIGYDIKGDDLQGSRVTVGWLGGIEESEKSAGGIGAPVEQRRVHFFDGNSVSHIKESDELSGRYKWLGTTSKYFFINLISENVREKELYINSFEIENKDESSNKTVKETVFSLSYHTFAESNRLNNFIFAGPTSYSELSSHGELFEKILFPVLGWTRVFFWADVWFPPVAEFILRVLLFLQSIVKDYGVAILALTLLTRIITYPLTHSSTKSMNRMKDVQPKINALRQKYKSNPQKMNTELMALYKAEGINPLNPGCLPMFLQMPIFIALFVVLRKAIELRGAGTFLLPWIKDLSQPESLISLPFDIPIYGSSLALLPIAMAVLTYFQNKMTIKDPNQKAMIYFMPLFMLVLFNNFPAGLVLYWTTSSGIQLIQQYILGKKKAVIPEMPVKANQKLKTVKR